MWLFFTGIKCAIKIQDIILQDHVFLDSDVNPIDISSDLTCARSSQKLAFSEQTN